MLKQDMPTGRTMKAAHQAAIDQPHTVIKAGELVDVRFTRSAPGLWTRRVIALLISKAAGEAWQDREFQITKAELRQGHKGNERFPALLEELVSIQLQTMGISVRGLPTRNYFGLLQWIEEEIDEGDTSIVTFKFNDKARAIFGASDVYARLNRAALLAFTSKYAITLYERGALLCERLDPTWRISVGDLRAALGIPPEKYRDWTDIRRFVTEPAISEINHIAHFTVAVREKRQGRKVVELMFTFGKKDEAGIAEAARELEQPKVGRAARRTKTAERIVEHLAELEAQLRSLPAPKRRFNPPEQLDTRSE